MYNTRLSDPHHFNAFVYHVFENVHPLSNAPSPPLAKQKPIYFINWECAVQEYLADTSMIIKKRRERLRVRLNPIIDKVVQNSHISMID